MSAHEAALLAHSTTMPDAQNLAQATHPVFRVLVVDEDCEVHTIIARGLAERRVLGRTIEIAHAHTAASAVRILREDPSFVLAFVHQASSVEIMGLKLVATIREELGLVDVRIVLRTMRYGFLEDVQAMTRYDVSDYHAKTELEPARLLATATSALRAYEARRIARVRARSSADSDARGHASSASDGTYAQLVGLVRAVHKLLQQATGAALVRLRAGDGTEHPIVAGTGRFAALVGRPVSAALDQDALQALVQSLELGEKHGGTLRRILVIGEPEAPTGALVIEASDVVTDEAARVLDLLAVPTAAALGMLATKEEIERSGRVEASSGLPSRSALERELVEMTNTSIGDPCLVFVEMERVLDVRDTMGSTSSDALVCAAAQRIRDCIPEARMIARLSTSTLAFLAEDAVTPGLVISAFETPLEIENIELYLAVRVATASAAVARTAKTDLFAAASLALSAARRSGSEGARVFDPAMTTETRTRLSRVGELRRGLERGELELHFQPQVQIHSGRLIGVESLVRWRKASGELVPPLMFIELAESSGLIVPIGDWVLREACRHARHWASIGLAHLRVAVNVSVAQFHQSQFARSVATAIEEHGVDPEIIELELTESIGLDDLPRARRIMQDVRDIGVTWALDDFGVGYSSLSYLSSLPVSRLKIDRSFVSQIRSATEGTSIPQLIIDLARTLDFGVIAEGVETAEVASILARLGCEEAQGYHYSKPLVAPDLLKFAARFDESEVSTTRALDPVLRAPTLLRSYG